MEDGIFSSSFLHKMVPATFNKAIINFIQDTKKSSSNVSGNRETGKTITLQTDNDSNDQNATQR